MLTNALTDKIDDVIHTDVCIVGAGPAGTTIARALDNSGINVTVIESGGFKYSNTLKDNFSLAGLTTDLWIGREYFTTHTARQIGGNAVSWQGWCRELDAEDFIERDYIPLSGWPVTKQELDPWYEQSLNILKLDKPTADTAIDKTDLVSSQFQISKQRFTGTWKTKLKTSKNIQLIYNATVSHLQPLSTKSDDKKAPARIQALHIVTENGKQFTVQAGHVILAAGGLGNPHLLLDSAKRAPAFTPLQNDWIGQCFMEHPHYTPAALVWINKKAPVDIANDITTSVPIYYLSRTLREKHQLMQSSFNIDPLDVAAQMPEEWREHFLTTHFDEKTADELRKIIANLHNEQGSWHGIYIRSEQAPNRANVYTLAKKKNAFKVSKGRMQWNYHAQDLDNMERSTRLFLQELAKLSPLLQVKFLLHDRERYSKHVIGGGHFMGTTRMSNNTDTGCVDAQGQFHGIENLHIAGSSVFPTGGFANPTQTIIALSLRLASRLKEQLKTK